MQQALEDAIPSGQVTHHASCITFHVSRFTFHVSRFTHHVSRIRRLPPMSFRGKLAAGDIMVTWQSVDSPLGSKGVPL